MRVRIRRALTAGLVGIGLVAAGAWGHAQSARTAQAFGTERMAAPIVISGNDVGFRMEGRKGSTPVGRLVVRIDGQWMDVESVWSSKPISNK
jgi:hypothetical protein